MTKALKYGSLPNTEHNLKKLRGRVIGRLHRLRFEKHESEQALKLIREIDCRLAVIRAAFSQSEKELDLSWLKKP